MIRLNGDARLAVLAGFAPWSPQMRSYWLGGPGNGFRVSWMEGAMTVYQPDPNARQHHAATFRVVRRGYDRDQVDAHFSQLNGYLREALDSHAKAEQARAELQREVTSLREAASLEQLGEKAAAVLQEAGRSAEQLVADGRRRAEAIIEKAQQQVEQLRADVTNEAQKVLEQAREVAEQLRREAEQERAAVSSETQQVRGVRDGLLDDLRRVHGEISGLLERTWTQQDQAGGADGGAALEVAAAPDAEVDKPAQPAKAAKRT